MEVSDITDDFLQALERESTALRKNRVEFVQVIRTETLLL